VTRTLVDIDDGTLAAAAKVLGTSTKVATVNAALALVATRSKRLAFLDALDEHAADLGDASVMKSAWR
jgi:Arc/MetJ family transcription regulator